MLDKSSLGGNYSESTHTAHQVYIFLQIFSCIWSTVMDSELMLVLMQILSEMHSQFKAFTAPALNWSKSKHGHTFPNGS